MRSPSSAERRRAVVAALGALAAFAGCASGSTELGTDAGLTVYASAPLTGPSAAHGRDIVAGARLALDDAPAEAGGIAVKLRALDSAPGELAVRAAENARAAIHDSTAIAYLGDFESGATRTSLPITNEAHLLQVSAASTAGDLVAPFPGSDEVPETQPSGERTFARVIPSDEAQVEALIAAAASRGVGSLAVLNDGSPFGRAIADAARSAAEGRIDVVPAREGEPSALFYAGYSANAADALAGRSSDVVLTTDVLLDAAFPRDSAYADLVIGSSALDPSQLPPAGRDLAARFRADQGRAPGRYAAYGYEAMAAILDAIDRADDPADRDAVVDAFFGIVDRSSVLGTYSIDEVGETTLDRVGSYRLTGNGLVPARALEVP